MNAMIERFIITETQNGNCEGYLESNPSIAVPIGPEPLYVGARVLVMEGFEPDTLLTTRWEGKSFDNFIPREINELAKWDIIEKSRDGIQMMPYKEIDK